MDTTQRPSFVNTLELLRHGQTVDELDQALSECIEATKDTLKISTLTVKLTIKANGINCFKVIDSVKTTVPAFDPEPTIVFPDKDGQLVRDDPRQRKLDLREVGAPKNAEVIDLPGKQGLRALGN